MRVANYFCFIAKQIKCRNKFCRGAAEVGAP